MLREFVDEAARLGPAPEPLRAQGAGGRTRYRTTITGWYLRRDQRAAVGTDGEFYLLTVPTDLRSLIRGARLEPTDPPLVLGSGGRDGESVDLRLALDRLRASRTG